jgi:carbonic anhydrase/acetyltransferase-like protein (isoleucine patch superfamily)
VPILPFEGRVPQIHPSAFIAATAVIIGEVIVEEDASVWYGCVLRGDLEPIVVGRGSNVQDNSVLHTGYKEPTIIHPNVTIGHTAIIHGCEIKSGCLIGMGAKILNNAVVEEDSIVGAGALVGERKVIPTRSLAVGIPAKVIRALTDEDVAGAHANTAKYVVNGRRHAAMMREWTQAAGWRL